MNENVLYQNGENRSIGPYTLVQKIGKGQFSVVYKALHKELNTFYACKVIQKNSLKTSFELLHFESELKAQLICCSKNARVAALIDLLDDQNNYYVFSELCHTDIFHLINNNANHRIDEHKCKSLFYQIMEGLSHIHSCGYAHRDIKPANVLLDNHGFVKLADFGFSATTSNEKPLLQTQCGTIGYTAPEVLSGERYDGFKADIWSCGVLLYTMLTGRLPFSSCITSQNIELMISEILYPSYLSSEAANLIKNILILNPDDRPSITSILEDPWLCDADNLNDDDFANSMPLIFVNLSDIYNIVKDKDTAQICLQGNDLCRRQKFDRKHNTLIQSCQLFTGQRRTSSNKLLTNKGNNATKYPAIRRKTFSGGSPQDLFF